MRIELHITARWLLGFWLLAAGCSVTPVPEPPNLDPPDIAKITSEVEPSIVFNTIVITGTAGAAQPDARIWVVNLDDPLAPGPVEVDVEADGSFGATINGEEGNMVRLQTRRHDLRSAPVDAIVHDRSTLAVVERRVCLEVLPGLELDLGEVELDDDATGAVSIRNGCDAALEISALSFRRDEPGLDVLTVPPVVIPVDTTARVEARCAPESSGLVEDILFMDLDSVRWPVTVFCRGR